MCEKLKKYTSSTKAKLLNPLVINSKDEMEYIPFICIYLNHFYIWNFCYITASTVSVFIYFQRSLFPFFLFTCYCCIILHAIIQFELKRLKKLVTQKICIPDCKISLDSFRCSVILSHHWIDVRRLKIRNTWHGSNWTKNFQAWISIVDF